jgi:CheY-like chemotaxis protein
MTPNTTTTPSALIVEDEAILLMLVAETLRDAGYQVYEAGDGMAAVHILETHPEIDIMISDIRMPGMSGYEVTRAALTLRPGLKVVLMTGYTEEAIPQNIANAGIRVLRKPFDIEQLPQLAKSVLDRHAD